MMMNGKRNWGLVAACLIPLSFANNTIASSEGDDNEDDSSKAGSKLIYEIKASQPRLNRRVTGDVVASIDGVPAEPVDSFVWDGKGSVPVKGKARLKIDSVANTGEI